MRIRVTNIETPLDEPDSDLNRHIARRTGLSPDDVAEVHIRRRSVDARNARRLKHVYTVEADVPLSASQVASLSGVEAVTRAPREDVRPGERTLRGRPVVVGAGPAGLFATWRLANAGYRPILLERGKSVEERRYDTAKFWKTGNLDPDSNVLFGEGGAGTFSDGKLTSRTKDYRKDDVLRVLVECGADDSIRYDARAHLGTNRLPYLLQELRRKLIGAGAEIRFSTRVRDIDIQDEVQVVATDESSFDCNAVILAIGHSARDTYEMLCERNVAIEPKAFAIGVRVQHSQELIDRAQYHVAVTGNVVSSRTGGTGGTGRPAGLDAAEYVLKCARTRIDRAVYSFCMCPGGTVIPCASEQEMLCCNGMSGESRSGPYANGAVVAEVVPEDFPSDGPLGGVALQREWERRAYESTGGTYALPVMSLDDFVNDRYRSGAVDDLALRRFPRHEFSDLRKLLPESAISSIRKACVQFNRQIPGWLGTGAVAFGVETRTSAPVRITRNAVGESVSTPGLFPCGEGAGYAGGIISAAIDGIRAAESVIRAYAAPG
jgi:uncharacterized protein